MMRFVTAVATAAILGAVSPAHAALISFNPIVATWGVPTGGTDLTYSGQGTENAAVNWGSGGPSGQSGYEFVAAALPLVVGEVPPDQDFVLGTFSHHNNPISPGTSISGVTLSISTQVFVDNVSQGTKNFNFDFTHWETENDFDPCADGGAHGVGVNLNGCADRVTATSGAITDSFIVDGVKYSLFITGFQTDSGDFDTFWTQEHGPNVAKLLGKVSATSVAVPEPTSLVLVGLGLVSLGARLRRRQ